MRWSFLLFVGVLFAGCAEEAAGPSVGQGQLGDGLGGITGLLIDDAFRPIPETEVLLQPAGLVAVTNENGEFAFSGLEPGSYVLRETSPNHEAKPTRVEVEEGFFSEAEVLARRLSSVGSTLITYEYAVFIDCSLSLLIALPFGCSFDQSGDSYREGFTADYTEYENVTYLVVEMLASKEGRFELDIWNKDHPEDSLGMLANDVFSGEYTKITLKKDEINTEHADLFDNAVWGNYGPFDTELIIFGEYSEELSEVDPFFLGAGVGVNLAVTGKFLHSLFINEPDESIENYCIYCP